MRTRDTQSLSSLRKNEDKDNVFDESHKAKLTIFRDFVTTDGQEQYATRKQIEELYKVPRKTLADNIKILKSDGLIKGAKKRLVAKDGRNRRQEVFNLNEVIAIGFRLRSDVAINLQRYTSNLLSNRIIKALEDKRKLELELSFFWNKSDIKDLYR